MPISGRLKWSTSLIINGAGRAKPRVNATLCLQQASPANNVITMHISLLLLLLLTPLTLFSQATEITRLDGTKLSVIELDQIVAGLMDSAKVEGLSLAVLNHNEENYIKSYGYKNKPKNEKLDLGTAHYAASFSKAVFSVLVLQLKEQGIIDLDVPLYTYLNKSI